jgi:TolA-binding protein
VTPPVPEAVEETSKQLFSAANAARRRGDVDAAIAGYHELQAKFPGSSEAALSRVSLGNLSLRRGASAQALEQFDAYLRQQAGGSLREEALRGKAEALGRLGRKAEARAAWKALLTQYPDSAYADLARSHLD